MNVRSDASISSRAGRRRPRRGAGDERAELGLVGDEAVLVVGLELAAVQRDVGGRVRPADQPLEEGEPAEHPARAVVGGEDRVPDAEPAQEVARL